MRRSGLPEGLFMLRKSSDGKGYVSTSTVIVTKDAHRATKLN